MPSRAASGAVFAAAVWLVALGLAACVQRGEPPACLDQRQEARNLALRGDIEPAQRLLDQVKQSCGPNSQSDIQHITKLIADKTAARDRQRQLEAARSAELQKFPSRSFVEWATARAGDISGKLAHVSCAERGTPDFGFCEGQRSDAPAMRLRYWQAHPDAYRYSLATTQPPSCHDLGPYRQVRVWSRSGSRYELCELTERRLRHLSALIVESGDTYEMHVFSQDYLNVDPPFEQRLRIITEAQATPAPSRQAPSAAPAPSGASRPVPRAPASTPQL